MLRIGVAAVQEVEEARTLTIKDGTRVFVTGDLDGNLKKLKQELKKVNFSPANDHLICTGDIIDRGSDNIELLTFLNTSKVSFTLGNHEHLMLESIMSKDKLAFNIWSLVGGSWHMDVDNNTLLDMCHLLLSRPLSILLEYRGAKIGFSHTLPQRWNWREFPTSKVETIESLLWSRKLFNTKQLITNRGVDFSVHGHNTTQSPLWIDNSYHLDTSGYGGPTIIELETLILDRMGK